MQYIDENIFAPILSYQKITQSHFKGINFGDQKNAGVVFENCIFEDCSFASSRRPLHEYSLE